MLNPPQAMQRAYAACQRGEWTEAERLCRAVLVANRDYFAALHLLGIITAQTQRPQEAAELLSRAVSVNPGDCVARSNLGNLLRDLKRPAEALESCERALALKPDYAEAWNNRGNALNDLHRHAEALASYDRALALEPGFAEAWNNRGNALNDLNRHAQALASYDHALALEPGNAEACNNRGIALLELERHAEALEGFERALALKPDFAEAWNNRGSALNDLKRHVEALESCERALALKPDFAGANNNRGVALGGLQRHAQALESYDRALALAPDFARAWNNRGVALGALQRHAQALASYDRALAVEPDNADAHSNRGNALNALKRHAEALESYDRALALEPDNAEIWNNRGNALNDLKRHADALESYERALQLDPDTAFLYGEWLHTRMRICAWDDISNAFARLNEKIGRHEQASAPFPVLATPSSPALQRIAAEVWVQDKYPASQALPEIPRRPRREKIRIGYFSADFREHPVSHLIAELFERHDRARFRVTAFSFGPDTNDAMRARLAAAFDGFIDVRDRADTDVALLARELGIDIAVDLNGFTEDSRTGIFALRAAPIQVNYLGYPGTMGAEYIDYLIADATLLSKEDERHYAEKIAYLPDSFQVNDTRRPVSDKALTREEAGLPRTGFVFCCFNKHYKITPDTFDRWMRIVSRVPGSVLWLSEDNEWSEGNLRKAAALRGVGADRLIFARRIPAMAEHLARYRLADLFLDTLPYNAHTTASDALWTGLPVLTCLGETYAGRVAASLLNGIRLPELVTRTPEQYESLATALATNPGRLLEIKQKLLENRRTAPLFDIQLFTRHLEAAYTTMYGRYHADLPPEHIHVQA